MKPPLAPTAVFFAALALFCLLFGGCKTTPLEQHHTPAIAAPSVAPVKDSIGDARTQVTAMRHGNDRIESKAIRALEFFPRP